MREHEPRGVQKRPLEMRDRAQVAGHAPVDAAVERVADDRMADRAQVHADLVRAAGVDRHLRERQRRRRTARARTMRVTASRLRRARADIFLRFDRIAADRRVDAPARLHLAPDERDVFLLDLAIVELPRQLLVRRVVLGDDHQPRRAAIEPVHDARPLLAADAAEIVDVMEQRVDQRAARVPGRRMHDHARRLVDDDEVAVLVEDRQRQRFGLRRRRRPARASSTAIAWPAFTGWFGFAVAAVDADVAVLDQPLDLRSRLAGEHRDEKDDRAGRPSLSSGTVKRGVHAATLPCARACGAGVAARARYDEHDDRERREDDRDELRRRERCRPMPRSSPR